jgi:YD repeat-containing protein
MGRSNGGRPGVKAYALEFCEPVIANSVIFVLLIILDLWSQANSLIPIHAVAGIIAVLLTFAACRSQVFARFAWGLVVLPGIFLIISALNAAQKTTFVQSAQEQLAAAYRSSVDNLNYGVGQVTGAVNTVGRNVAYGYDAASDRIASLNAAGQSGLNALSNSWNNTYNSLINSGKTPAQAAIGATAENGKPPAGTSAAATAAASGANTTDTVMKGEYEYLCNPVPSDSTIAAACNKCAKDTDRDKCISVISVNAVCLGNLVKGESPSSTKRDLCIGCTKINQTTVQQDACRAMAMSGGTKADCEKAAADAAAAAAKDALGTTNVKVATDLVNAASTTISKATVTPAKPGAVTPAKPGTAIAGFQSGPSAYTPGTLASKNAAAPVALTAEAFSNF